jgi:hypothetical protein
MKKFVLMGALAATLSLSLVPSAFAEGDAAASDSTVIDQYSKGLGADSVSQVSSVSELTDVDPNVWAFQALKSLVERYGCIEGYPSKKYLGNRPLSRYEFAAGLNACLDKIGEQIAAAVAPLATKEDLAALQRLQEEFKNELAVLRGRVDSLEARTKELEMNQFSTTTKLDGSVVMAVQGGGTGGGVITSPNLITNPATGRTFSTGILGYNPAVFGNNLAVIGDPNNLGSDQLFVGAQNFSVPGEAANTTFVGRTTLNFRSSFTGNDELLVRMRGVTGQDISGTFPGIASNLGTAFYAGGQTGTTSFDGSTSPVNTNGNATVSFDKIRYTTPFFSENLRIFVGPRIDLYEIIDTNSFANNEEVDFSNGLMLNNPLITYIPNGPGVGFDFNFGILSFRGAYIAGQGGNSNGLGFGGLTGSNSLYAAELEWRIVPEAKLKLQYSGFSTQSADPLYPAPSTFGPSQTNAFGVNAEWALGGAFGLFGRYGTGTANNPVATAPNGGQYQVGNFTLTTWQAGISVGDLFGLGNQLGLSVAQPIRATNFASATEIDYELYYNFRLNDRITITPDIQVITSPNNISGNSTITLGTLRAVFNF